MIIRFFNFNLYICYKFKKIKTLTKNTKSKLLRKLFLASTLVLLSIAAEAQKEWSNWYSSGISKLTFKNGSAEKVINFIDNPPPVPPFENLYHFAYWGDGGISYSDPITGEMQFIISRRLGFGKDYKDFPNDTLLRACPGNKKSYQIIPIPDNPGKFYVIQFQSSAAGLAAMETGLQVRCPNAIGLGYSIVDLSKNNGLGDFVSMNNVITQGLTEQITYVRHANGKDVWIICHPYNTAEYHSILATATGFSQPVISNIGAMINGGSRSVYGTLEASHDGKLLVGTRTLAATTGKQFSDVELFDFDNATGKLNNYRTMPMDGRVEGMQFSPDNSKLYAIGFTPDFTFSKIFQWDFNETDLATSRIELFSGKNGLINNIQLGPDGKIYISRFSEFVNFEPRDYLMIIQCPNLPKYASNLKIRGIEYGYFQFPDFVNDFINVPRVIPPPEFSIGNDTAICFGTHTLSAPTGWESYQWNTGETTRQITIDKPGLYFVLTGSTGFSCPSGYGYINIGDKAAKLDLGSDTGLCSKTSFTLRVPEGYSDILWTNGSNTRDSVLFGGGEIIISALDPQGCFTNDTINVYEKYYPRAQFGADTVLCNNDKLILRLEPTNIFGGNAVYNWSDNSTNETLQITEPGIYWGTVNFDGCTISDTIRVSYINAEEVSIGNDTTICLGDSLLLSPSIIGANYLWSTGETTSSIYAKTTGYYWVSVRSGVCVLRDTIYVEFNDKPIFSIGNDTSICAGNSLLLNPGISGGTYLWQDGSTNDRFNVVTGGKYSLVYTQNSCSVKDSIEVIYNELPTVNLGNDTSFCANTTFTLNASHPSIKSYVWSNQTTLPTLSITNAGRYTVMVTGHTGCVNADTIQVSEVAVPAFTLGNDTTLCEGSVINFSLNIPGATYTWQNGSTSPGFTIQNPGEYWLQANRNGCSYSDTIFVNYKPMPKINLGLDTTLCEGATTLLNANFPNAIYTWQDGSNQATLLVNNAGLYHVSLELNGCTFRDSIQISYILIPKLTLVSDTAVCAGQSIILTPATNTRVDYLWQNGDRRPTFTVADTGRYFLTVSNECGVASQTVDVLPGFCQIYLPTGFTPNGDNLNDIFRIKNPFQVKMFRMQVFSRYGDVIFESNNMQIGWDGKYKGQLLPSGNYIWTVAVEYLDNRTESLRGSVMLLR